MGLGLGNVTGGAPFEALSRKEDVIDLTTLAQRSTNNERPMEIE